MRFYYCTSLETVSILGNVTPLVLIGTGYTLEEVDTAIRYVVPEKLEYGAGYSLVEISAPYGYTLNSEPVYFDVSVDNRGQQQPRPLVCPARCFRCERCRTGHSRIQKTQKGGRRVMELKTILAIGLVVFIVGTLIFLKIRAKKK